MDLHECRLADGGEGRHRRQLARSVVETRARPDVAERVGFGRIGQEGKFLPHALERLLRHGHG